MDQLTTIQMLVERQEIPKLMKNEVLEIVTRNAEAKYKPFIKAYFPEGGEKASELARQLLGDSTFYSLEEVRGAMRLVRHNLNTISKNARICRYR